MGSRCTRGVSRSRTMHARGCCAYTPHTRRTSMEGQGGGSTRRAPTLKDWSCLYQSCRKGDERASVGGRGVAEGGSTTWARTWGGSHHMGWM